jgi:hypothetical protein
MVVLVTMFSVVVGLLTLLVAGLLRSHAQIMRALHELGADVGTRPSARSFPEPASGRQPSDVVGTSTEGDAVSIGVLGARNSTLLAFLSSGCHTCADFWRSFAHPDGLDVPGDARLVIVTKDAGEESISKIRKLEPADVPVVMGECRVDDRSSARGRRSRRRGRKAATSCACPTAERSGSGVAHRCRAARRGRHAGRSQPVSAHGGRLPGARRRFGRTSMIAVTAAGLTVAVVAGVRSSWSP